MTIKMTNGKILANFFIGTLLGTLVLFFSTHVKASSANRAKAGELSLHRTEKLVILKKIEESFGTASQSVKVEVLTQTSPTDPTFKATVSQVPASDKTRKAVEIFMDGNGKALRNNTLSGGDADSPTVWPDKDALSLLETVLHCVQGELIGTSRACADDTALRAFSDSFETADLLPLKAADGSVIGAQGRIRAMGITQTLLINMKLNAELADQLPIIVSSQN